LKEKGKMMAKTTIASDGRDAWRKFLQLLAALGLLKIAKQFIDNRRLTISQVIHALSALGTLGWMRWA
jgi:hypothetical protein